MRVTRDGLKAPVVPGNEASHQCHAIALASNLHNCNKGHSAATKSHSCLKEAQTPQRGDADNE